MLKVKFIKIEFFPIKFSLSNFLYQILFMLSPLDEFLGVFGYMVENQYKYLNT
jgi:hypothetical protein